MFRREFQGRNGCVQTWNLWFAASFHLILPRRTPRGRAEQGQRSNLRAKGDPGIVHNCGYSPKMVVSPQTWGGWGGTRCMDPPIWPIYIHMLDSFKNQKKISRRTSYRWELYVEHRGSRPKWQAISDGLSWQCPNDTGSVDTCRAGYHGDSCCSAWRIGTAYLCHARRCSFPTIPKWNRWLPPTNTKNFLRYFGRKIFDTLSRKSLGCPQREPCSCAAQKVGEHCEGFVLQYVDAG